MAKYMMRALLNGKMIGHSVEAETEEEVLVPDLVPPAAPLDDVLDCYRDARGDDQERARRGDRLASDGQIALLESCGHDQFSCRLLNRIACSVVGWQKMTLSRARVIAT